MQGEKAMNKKGNISEMSREDRGTILKRRIVIYELMITVLQIAIIVFCFLAYEKVDAIQLDGTKVSLLDRGIGDILAIFILATHAIVISLIRFSMLLAPWFRELWEDAWKDGQREEKSAQCIPSDREK
jgi:hypothetical protein